MPDSHPSFRSRDGALVLAGIAWTGRNVAADVTVRDGRITGIVDVASPPRWVALPPLADLHVHANRAYTPPDVRPRGLEGAVRNVHNSVFEQFSTADYRGRAERLYVEAQRRATARLRTHADVDPSIGLSAVEASVQAARAQDDDFDVEVVAFASAISDPVTPAIRDLLRAAISAGATLLGAVPAFYPDPRKSIDALLDLALELDVAVDLHLDEHLDPSRSVSDHLARATLQRGYNSRVTLSHGCAIAALDRESRARTIENLARADITVIALPRTNLYLQDAHTDTPVRRGITCVKELLRGGVAVRFASDNVRDVFYPFGDADLLGVAMDGILASQLDHPPDVVAAICDGRWDFRVGGPADMALFPGEDIDAILSDPPRERWRLSGARLRRVDRPE